MKRVLITGMSGTGKSSVVSELRRRGHPAVDVGEPEWSEYGPAGDWRWREERIAELLAAEDEAGVLFLSGCAENQVKFYPQFDHIVLLTAPANVLVERLQSRTTNPYGKEPREIAEVMGYLATIEPRLRRAATHVIDATAPMQSVATSILDLVYK